ncbi:MAG: transposase, partial [Ignavibacteria bacterium]|nr:transposase [Ignavibacteria bacterium]
MPMKITYKQHLSEIIEYFKENKNLVYFINSIVLRFLKYLIETLLEAKVEYERSKALIKRNWYRNGYYTRHLITKFGLIENIRVPRLRYMVYQNNIFDKWERRLSDVNDFITKVFTQGESYRDIKRIVKHFFNEPTMSLSTISRITNKVFDRLKEFHNRRLENKYSIIWIDGMYFSIKDQKEELEIYNKKRKKRRNFCVLIALGLNKKTNKKEIIDFLLVGKETKRNYKRFINSLIDR